MIDTSMDDDTAFKQVKLQYRSWEDPLFIPEKYINVQAIHSTESIEVYAADIEDSTEKVTIFRMEIPTNDSESEKLRVLHQIYSNVLHRSRCKHLDPLNTLMLYTKGKSVDEMKHVYIILPSMYASLDGIVRSNGAEVTLSHIAWILYQIIWRIHCCYDLGLLPGSIRGGNILLNEECDVEFLNIANGFVNCDLITGGFSSSNVFSPFYKDVIGWKCAPEWKFFRFQEAVNAIIHTNLQAMDMWSVGALASHITLGRPIFPDATIGYVNTIVNTLAHFPESVLSPLPTNAQKYIQSLHEKCKDSQCMKENLKKMFPDTLLRTYAHTMEK